MILTKTNIFIPSCDSSKDTYYFAFTAKSGDVLSTINETERKCQIELMTIVHRTTLAGSTSIAQSMETLSGSW